MRDGKRTLGILSGSLVLTLLLAAAARSLDMPVTLKASYQAFLEGRLQDAADGYRYLTSLGLTTPGADAQLAIVTRDGGELDAALPLWIKSTMIHKEDAFLWNQRGWAYLAVDRLKQAKEAFLKALDRSAASDTQGEANFGLGFAALLDSHPRAAMPVLRDALVQGPYLIPAASYLTAQTALKLKDKQAAMAYLRQSIDLDPLNYESTKALAELYRRTGQNQAAWRAYHRLLTLDVKDEDSAEHLEKLSKHLNGSPQDWEPVRRLSKPMLDAGGKGSPKPGDSPTIRVALYSDSKGEPATVTHLYFMSNSPFNIESSTLEMIREDERAFQQWEITFRPETNIVEVRDTIRNIQYTTKQPFKISGSAVAHSVLLKSAVFAKEGDHDPGDRELRGSVVVVPSPYGFTLVNELPLEDFLYGAVGAAMPSQAPLEAYKAQAVLSRTKALWFRENRGPNLEKADFCDSDRCQIYIGINSEMRAATKAVVETHGVYLRYKGKPARLAQHANCGGITGSPDRGEDPDWAYLESVHDAPPADAKPMFKSPLELERWIRGFPPKERYCEVGSLSPAVESRWVRIIDAADIEARARRIKPIGLLKHIRALRRSPTGRVRTLRVIGTRGHIDLKGHEEMQEILSPGSLRSNLFTLQTMTSGGKTKQVFIWGAGTGHGLGMCNAGAIGQAATGVKWPFILKHYFPNLEVPGTVKQITEKEGKVDRRKRRRLNPRKRSPAKR